MVKIKSCKVKNASAWILDDGRIVVEHYGTKIAEYSKGVLKVYNGNFGSITASDARAVMQATGLRISRKNGGVQCVGAKVERF